MQNIYNKIYPQKKLNKIISFKMEKQFQNINFFHIYFFLQLIYFFFFIFSLFKFIFVLNLTYLFTSQFAINLNQPLFP